MPKKIVEAIAEGCDTQADAEWAAGQIKAALAGAAGIRVTVTIWDEDVFMSPDLPEDVIGEPA